MDASESEAPDVFNRQTTAYDVDRHLHSTRPHRGQSASNRPGCILTRSTLSDCVRRPPKRRVADVLRPEGRHVMVLALYVALLLLIVVIWNSAMWPGVSGQMPDRKPSVSVLIPARNEEANIEECLATVLSQGDAVCEALVYDDESKDRTAPLVAAAAESDPRVRLLPPKAVPAGWHGKPHACHRLAESASGDWLLFLDADARLLRGSVERLVAEAEARQVTMLSPWPGLDMRSFPERLLMPMLNFVVFTLFPAPLSLKSQMPSLGLAHGACLLFRRAEYAAVGGHELVRAEIFEDTALARAWRAGGYRGICLDGQDVVRVRMYASFSGIWAGFLKNYHPAFRTRMGFWMFLALHVFVYIVPWLVAVVGASQGYVYVTAWSACGAGIAARLVQCARFRYPVWSAFLHPLSEIVLVALGLCSWYHYRIGRGVAWRGRRYHG